MRPPSPRRPRSADGRGRAAARHPQRSGAPLGGAPPLSDAPVRLGCRDRWSVVTGFFLRRGACQRAVPGTPTVVTAGAGAAAPSPHQAAAPVSTQWRPVRREVRSRGGQTPRSLAPCPWRRPPACVHIRGGHLGRVAFSCTCVLIARAPPEHPIPPPLAPRGQVWPACSPLLASFKPILPSLSLPFSLCTRRARSPSRSSPSPPPRYTRGR